MLTGGISHHAEFFWSYPLCRACMHSFFHRLSILERATDHKCIKECSYSKRNVGRIKCNGPVNFSQRGGISSNTCVFPPSPPPPPPSGFFSSPWQLPPPPLSPKAPLFQRRGHLRLWGSDRGVLSIEGWPIRYDSSPWHI